MIHLKRQVRKQIISSVHNLSKRGLYTKPMLMTNQDPVHDEGPINIFSFICIGKVGRLDLVYFDHRWVFKSLRS